MPVFNYRAVTPSGELVQGVRDDESRSSVVRWLQSEGHLVLSADTKPAPSTGKGRWIPRRLRSRGITGADIANFTLSLQTLLSAGVSLDNALAILERLLDNERLHALTRKLREEVRGGAAFSRALQKTGVFSPLYVSMTRAGESSGALEAALNRIGKHLERSRELRDAVQAALAYPAILAVVSVLSLIAILGFVVPRFTQIFADAGQALPWLTRMVVGLSDLIVTHGWLVLAVAVALVLTTRQRLRDPAVRLQWDRRVLRLPLIGELIAKLETTRAAATLSTLLVNGVPLPAALEMAAETVSNRAMGGALHDVSRRIRQGGTIGTEIERSGVFPSLAVELIAVGEASGELEPMLERLGVIYERETRATVAKMVTLLEPALILILGLVTATIILSILIAMLGVNELVT